MKAPNKNSLFAQFAPIFTPEFGWIYPVGGGDGEETEAEKTARLKVEAETQATKDAEAKAVADKKAEDEAKVKAAGGITSEENAKTLVELEALRKFKKDQESKAEQDAIDKLEGEAKQKAIADAAVKKSEDAEAEAARLRIDNAIANERANFAARGEEVIPEFIQTVDKVEDVPEMMKKAFERQEQVMENRIKGLPNFPAGGGGNKKVPQVEGAKKLIEAFTSLQGRMQSGDRSPATSRAWNTARQNLIKAGINPLTLKPEPAKK